MRPTRSLHLPVLCLALAAALSGCASAPMPADGGGLPAQRIAEILASPDRSAADRQNDLRRKPEALLAFIGPRPGQVALDVSAGGGYGGIYCFALVP